MDSTPERHRHTRARLSLVLDVDGGEQLDRWRTDQRSGKPEKGHAALQRQGPHRPDHLAEGHEARRPAQGLPRRGRPDPHHRRRLRLRRHREGVSRLSPDRRVQVGQADRRRQVRAQLRHPAARDRARRRGGRHVDVVDRVPARPGLRRRPDRHPRQGRDGQDDPGPAHERRRPRPRQAAALEEGRQAADLHQRPALVVEARPRLQGAARHARQGRRREPARRVDPGRMPLRRQTRSRSASTARRSTRATTSFPSAGKILLQSRGVRAVRPQVRAASA